MFSHVEEAVSATSRWQKYCRALDAAHDNIMKKCAIKASRGKHGKPSRPMSVQRKKIAIRVPPKDLLDKMHKLDTIFRSRLLDLITDCLGTNDRYTYSADDVMELERECRLNIGPILYKTIARIWSKKSKKDAGK